MSETTNRFAELAAVNVGPHIEKKGKLSYLSWPWAVDQLLRRDPGANWQYGEPVLFGATMMVSCTVTAFGTPRTMHLPVMNHMNKAIEGPNAFEINTAMQRCLVKAIALHGLGLYIYAGEDLPPSEESIAPGLDNAIIAKFEAATTQSDIAAAWNGIAKEARPDYRDTKDRALGRVNGAVHA